MRDSWSWRRRKPKRRHHISRFCPLMAIKRFGNDANIISNAIQWKLYLFFKLIAKCMKMLRKMKFHNFCSSLCLRTSLSFSKIVCFKANSKGQLIELSSHHTIKHSHCQRLKQSEKESSFTNLLFLHSVS